MYCPICFQNTMQLKSNGVIKLSFDGKSRDTSLFLYNTKVESPEFILKSLTKRVNEFMRWYSSFENKEVIENPVIYSCDFVCENNCAIDIDAKISVVDFLFDRTDVYKILKKACTEHKIDYSFTKESL